MIYNNNPDYCENNELETLFMDIVEKVCNLGFLPIISNDFSSWNFLHNFGVKLKDDPCNEPFDIFELQILECLIESKSFNYWDDEYPSITVNGFMTFYVNINGNVDTKSMPVGFSITCMKDGKWYFDSFISNYVIDNSSFDKNKYDKIIEINSPKQMIVLSTHDRIRRMKRLFFEKWEFD
jgi:hypothetical protein